MNRSWTFALPLILGSIAPQIACAYLYKEVRDWAVSCSPGLTCTAGFADYENQELYSINLRRSSAPYAPLELVLPFPAEFSADGDLRSVFNFEVDGRLVLSFPLESATIHAQDREIVYREEEPIAALLGAMKTGDRLIIGFTDGVPATLNASLSGVTGSLLYMDEAQDRIERVDALHSVGQRPAPAGAASSDITELADLPPSIRRDFTEDFDGCGGIEPDRFRYMGAFRAELGEGEVMIGAPCGLGGAYNQPFALYFKRGDRFEMAALPIMGSDGPTIERLPFNIGYNPVTRRLDAFYKGRGIGDCGTFMVWSIEIYGMGATPVLREQREKGDCDGDAAGGPTKWPAVWPPE